MASPISSRCKKERYDLQKYPDDQLTWIPKQICFPKELISYYLDILQLWRV